MTSVFSTAFELRGADLHFFSCAETNWKKNGGEFFADDRNNRRAFGIFQGSTDLFWGTATFETKQFFDGTVAKGTKAIL
jgi:hypothetical protein